MRFIDRLLRPFSLLIAALAFVCGFSPAGWTVTPSTVNGVGEFTELSQQVFIANLLTERPVTDAEELLSRDMAATMQLRVTAGRISQRRFVRYWLESITVNTSSSTLLAHNARFSRFSQLFKGALRRGDLMALAYTPGNGLIISLNDVELAHMRGPSVGDFFRVLLRSWIGEIPLSSDVRKGLLSPNDLDARMVGSFNSLSYAPERQLAVRQWLTEPGGSEGVASTPVPAVAATPSPTAQPAITPTTPAPSPAASPRPSPTVAATKKATPPRATPSPKAVPEARPDDDAEDADDMTLAMDEKSLMIRQQFYARVSSAALKYQTLPRQAFQRRIEGDVRVMVTLNRTGEVVSAELAEASAHKFLNDQALDAVREAAPYPPIPDELEGNRFIFTVPFRYRLPY